MANKDFDTIIDYVNCAHPDLPGEEYAVTGICIGCGKCLYVCPEDCIVHDGVPYYIEPGKCRGCGSCAQVCPVSAISIL